MATAHRMLIPDDKPAPARARRDQPISYTRPRGMRWQPQDVPPRYPELSHGLKACLIAAAVLVALLALAGCSVGYDTELAVRGYVFPMDAEDCARISAKIGGTCYDRT